MKNDVPRQFSDDPESMVFNLDSESGHIARETIQFLKKNNVNFTDKEEWMPSLRSCLDGFRFVGNSQAPLQKRYVNTSLGHINKLKKDEWNKLEHKN